MYRQKPVKGGRAHLNSAMIHKAEQMIDRDCKRFNVGKSFVIATIVCYHYGIKEQEDYKNVERGRK